MADEYELNCNLAAGLDACSFGYGRAILNTIPSVVQAAYYFIDEEKTPQWTNSWINTVNEYVNSRSLREKAEDFYNKPVNNFFIKNGVYIGIRYKLNKFGFYK